jgi:hypothetical protein
VMFADAQREEAPYALSPVTNPRGR